jgi:hypothetical protein
MRARLVIVASLVVFAPLAARAQANTCPPGTFTGPGNTFPDRSKATQDVCQMAVDLFQFVAPEVGLALTGGNATLGQGGALGGLGHFSVGIRGNVFQGDMPDVAKFPTPSVNGAQTRTGNNALPTKHQIMGLPAVDASIGLFKGIPLGLTNVGGVDLLLSATYVPTVGGADDDFQIKPKSNLQVGYGARLGLIQESLLTPGVGVTYLKRDVPTTTITGSSSSLSVEARDVDVKTSAWRVVASKSLLVAGIAVGIGQDRYKESATVQGTTSATIPAQTSDPITLSQDLTRTNMFLDLSLNLPLLKIVGEVGQVSGGKIERTAMNEFTGGSPTQSRLYGSLGLGVGF